MVSKYHLLPLNLRTWTKNEGFQAQCHWTISPAATFMLEAEKLSLFKIKISRVTEVDRFTIFAIHIHLDSHATVKNSILLCSFLLDARKNHDSTFKIDMITSPRFNSWFLHSNRHLKQIQLRRLTGHPLIQLIRFAGHPSIQLTSFTNPNLNSTQIRRQFFYWIFEFHSQINPK